jgi:EpsI family protein
MTEARSLRSSAVSRRMVLAGLAAGLTATGAYALAPRRAEHRLLNQKLRDLIPATIGPWRYGSTDGVIVAREEEALPTDGYDQLVGRTYEAPDQPSIMLLVAYGSTQGSTLQLHRPETCYPGQGFTLSDFSEPDLDFARSSPVRARRFTATRDSRIERLVYWTRIAESFPRNTAGEYRAILGSVLTGTIPDGVLVRISTIDGDIAAGDRAIDRFIPELIRAMGTPGREILLGDSIAAEIAGMDAGRRG